ncbi:MAG TPA: tellurite resistance TerB family protein [Rhizomicrobium sp.]|nr:tellurite resistance TerB family protein [Rhizomicrobium sp.]
MPTISHHAALIYVMVVVSASDGTMSEKVLRAIGDLTKHLPVFRHFDEQRLIQVSQECASILTEPDGLTAVLGLIGQNLPEHLRETAYWLALEVTLTDTHVMIEEIRVLELLRRSLNLDRLVAAALERGARARYQTA